MKIGYYYPVPFPSLDADIVHIVQMCRAFALLGHDVTLFVPRNERYADQQAAVQEAGEWFGQPLLFDVVFLPRRTVLGRLRMLGSLPGARRAIRQAVLDLIYTRAPWAMLLLPLQAVPFVFEAHELELHRESRLLTWVMQRLMVAGSRRRHCKKFVVISAALGREWRKLGVPAHKIHVAHDAVDLSLFVNTLSKRDARQSLNLAPRGPLIVYTGSLYANRGIELILTAAQRMPEAEFVLVGGVGGDVENYRAQAARLSCSNVRFTGQVPHHDVPRWLAAADIELMMWTWRVRTIAICSPMKLFEYMAAERLIVGPAFPTITEVMQDGVHGILFEPDHPEALVAALRKAIPLIDKSPMPAAARRHVAEHYTWQERCRRILAALAP
ncbi:glycosyltransferase [candidate division KSB1 bacterium]|nr:glycosyltransferase [candidate division KSB1 bacterium]